MNKNLFTASRNGDTDTVKELIEEKASLDVKDDYGRTALIVASEYYKPEIVKLLIQA